MAYHEFEDMEVEFGEPTTWTVSEVTDEHNAVSKLPQPIHGHSVNILIRDESGTLSFSLFVHGDRVIGSSGKTEGMLYPMPLTGYDDKDPTVETLTYEENEKLEVYLWKDILQLVQDQQGYVGDEDAVLDI